VFENALSQYPKDNVEWKQHIVKRGDSLDKIARHYHTSVAALREANGLKDNTIHPNQSLVIAASAVERSALPPNPMLAIPRSKSTHRLTYTVRRGDSLARIADRFNVSISAIADWNDVDPSGVLKPGRRLVLHVPEASRRLVSR
jgi:membrane-bound lytic murein transglycosylase D